MGNFYTNIVLRDNDADAVIASLGAMGRRAYVAATENATIVFDERCDTQDVEELERLARELSRQHGPALAICNHDDDVLWYALAADGRAIDRYNSFPSYFDEGGDAPVGGDAARLCQAFGVLDHTSEVHALLQRNHSDIGFEIDRHAELCRLAGLPMESVGMGYGYVSRGEYSNAGAAAVVPVGGAPPVGGARPVDGASASAQSAAPVTFGPSPELANTPAGEMVFAFFALARSDIDVPQRFAHVLGDGRVNAMLALERLKMYIATNALIAVGRPALIRADAFVEELLGIRELPFSALVRVFSERFGVEPLTSAEQAAFQSNDQEFGRRHSETMMRILEQLDADREKKADPPSEAKDSLP
jgi:hypothetical protein